MALRASEVAPVFTPDDGERLVELPAVDELPPLVAAEPVTVEPDPVEPAVDDWAWLTRRAAQRPVRRLARFWAFMTASGLGCE